MNAAADSNTMRADFLKVAAGAAIAGGLMAPVVASASEETTANGEVDDLQVLLIKEAIHDQIVNYCISMDRLDQGAGLQCFYRGLHDRFWPRHLPGRP